MYDKPPEGGFFAFQIIRETLNKSAFYGKPGQRCDAGIDRIKVLAALIFPQKFPHLFNQRLLRTKSRALFF